MTREETKRRTGEEGKEDDDESPDCRVASGVFKAPPKSATLSRHATPEQLRPSITMTY